MHDIRPFVARRTKGLAPGRFPKKSWMESPVALRRRSIVASLVAPPTEFCTKLLTATDRRGPGFQRPALADSPFLTEVGPCISRHKGIAQPGHLNFVRCSILYRRDQPSRLQRCKIGALLQPPPKIVRPTENPRSCQRTKGSPNFAACFRIRSVARRWPHT